MRLRSAEPTLRRNGDRLCISTNISEEEPDEASSTPVMLPIGLKAAGLPHASRIDTMMLLTTPLMAPTDPSPVGMHEGG